MKTINQNSAKVSLGKRQLKYTRIFYPIHFKATGKGNWYEQDLEYFPKPTFNLEFLPERVQLEYYYKAKIVDFGLVNITVKARPLLRAHASVSFWDQDFEIGDTSVFEVFNTILNGYLNSPEFIQKRKEARTWN